MYIRIEIQSLEELTGFFALVRGDDPTELDTHKLKDITARLKKSFQVLDSAEKADADSTPGIPR